MIIHRNNLSEADVLKIGKYLQYKAGHSNGSVCDVHVPAYLFLSSSAILSISLFDRTV